MKVVSTGWDYFLILMEHATFLTQWGFHQNITILMNLLKKTV
jgi:hypothetical protein